MNKKQKIDSLLSTLSTLAITYGLKQEMEAAIQEHHKFRVRLPIVGAFSTGKSTLINALLKDKLLGVQVTAETCLPTELRYAESESILLVNESGPVAELSRQQLKDQNYPIENPSRDHWIEVSLPSPQLAQFKDLVLVDMPGWDSGIAEHNQAIDNYVHRSGAYCLAVSAEEGALRQSIKQVLAELKLFTKPLVLVITKSDKRLPADISAIEQNITLAVSDVLGSAPLSVITTSARKKQLKGLVEAIGGVNQLADSIYHNMVLTHFIALLERTQNKIQILLNEENLSVEQARLACDKIPQELEELTQQLSKIEQQIDVIVPKAIERAKSNLRNHLASQLSSLTNSIIRGSNIENEIGSALRQAFLTATEQDFKPMVSQCLKSLQNLGDLAPSQINVNSNFESADSPIDSNIFNQVISFVLTKVVTLIPILKPLAPVIHVLANIFTSEADKRFQQEQQREEAKDYVLHSLIPEVLNQAEPSIRNSFKEMATRVKLELRQESKKKALDKETALRTLQQELKKSQQAEQTHKDKLRSDLAEIQSIKQQLETEQ